MQPSRFPYEVVGSQDGRTNNLKVKLNIIVIIMNIFQMSFSNLLAYDRANIICVL